MGEPIPPPARIAEKAPGKVERVVTKTKELTQKGKEWFKDKWDKVISKPRDVLNDINISLPTKIEDTYLVDSSEKSDHLPENFPKDSKDKIIPRLFEFLKKRNELPKPGYGCKYPASWQHADEDSPTIMYGKKLDHGSNGTVHYDSSTGELTHLWGSPTPEQAEQNVHQKELYRKLSGEHPFFKFVREVPGGWTTKYIENQGDLKDYVKSGGKFTPEQINKAVDNLREMQKLSGEAHGDIVRRHDFVEDPNGIMQKSFDSIEPYGFINFQNTLIDKNGDIVILDYAGNSDPSATGGWKEPDRHDTKSKAFMENELKFFEEGLKSLITTEPV